MRTILGLEVVPDVCKTIAISSWLVSDKYSFLFFISVFISKVIVLNSVFLFKLIISIFNSFAAALASIDLFSSIITALTL